MKKKKKVSKKKRKISELDQPIDQDISSNNTFDNSNNISQIIDDGNQISSPSKKRKGNNGNTITLFDLGFKKKPLSHEEFDDMYKNCVALSSANKINKKNTWSLKLIDYIDDLWKGDEKSELPNFQAATGALDASVKIYSSRVDSVHSDAYKMLGGLSRDQKEKENDIPDEDDKDEMNENETVENNEIKENETTEKVVKKKRNTRKGKSTLEKNISNLNSKDIEVEFLIDPLFRKTSQAIDLGGTRGLLLNQLNVYNGCGVIFDSSDVVNIESENDIGKKDEEFDLKEIEDQFKNISSNLYQYEICPMYSNFSFSTGSRNLDTMLLEDNDSNEGDNSDLGVTDLDIEAQEKLLENNLNDIMNPIVNLDIPNDIEISSQAPRLSQQNINHLALSNDEIDYMYFNKEVFKDWEGPSHWKFQEGKDEDKVKEVKETKTRSKKDNFISFTTKKKKERNKRKL